MAEFVKEDVIDEPVGKEHEGDGEVDARAPSGDGRSIDLKVVDYDDKEDCVGEEGMGTGVVEVDGSIVNEGKANEKEECAIATDADPNFGHVREMKV
jgi:hypothetical protein